jgi:hypothetical protein
MGGGYSASASSGAESANKISVGPTTFGGVSFGAQGAPASNTVLYIVSGLVLAAVAWFLRSNK